MKLSEYTACDATDLARLIARGEITAAEVKEVAVNAINKVNGRINAVIEIWQQEESQPQGPFQGVPMLVKDLGIAVKGQRNELGSQLAAGYLSPHDSNLAQRMRHAGLMLLGRTTTPELATSTTTESRLYGATALLNKSDFG